jgi:protein-tyrosine phosphatase
MIDLHAHILPAIDDGPPTTEAALEMARAAVAGGTRAIATTSHIEHSLNVAPEQIVSARETFAARLADEGIELELLAGGEIGPRRLPELGDDELRALALGGGPYVLLECTLQQSSPPMDVLVDDLHERGFDVLLAHPERSPSFQRDPELLAGLVEQGALAQVTAGALTGHFGALPQRTAEAMIRDGLVHVLASDAHDAVHRPPALAADGLLSTAEHEWMTTAVPEAIVTGRPLPIRSS